LDTKTGELTYSNAGHNPAYLVPAADPETHESYIRTGAPLGIFGDLAWEQGTTHLAPDDALLLYSDGVTEARSPADELYTRKRLEKSVSNSILATATDFSENVKSDLFKFIEQAPQSSDDIQH